jgi:REP element-mobilizing transposase RayT
LTKKYEKKSFSQSFAEFNAESRKDKNLIINILRNSAVHQLDSARNKKELFRQPRNFTEFLIMSNHVHIVARSSKNDLSGTFRDFKKYTSKKIVELIDHYGDSRKEWMLRL